MAQKPKGKVHLDAKTVMWISWNVRYWKSYGVIIHIMTPFVFCVCRSSLLWSMVPSQQFMTSTVPFHGTRKLSLLYRRCFLVTWLAATAIKLRAWKRLSTEDIRLEMCLFLQVGFVNSTWWKYNSSNNISVNLDIYNSQQSIQSH